MPAYRRGAGSVYRRGKVFWLSYYVDGKHINESAKTPNRHEARRLLAEKLGKAAAGELTPSADRILFDDLADDMLEDYKVNAKKSIKDVERSVKVLRMYFGGRKAQSIMPSEVMKYVSVRQKKIKNASINRELSALKRMFNLGIEREKIFRKPKIKMLLENNARKGFFEWHEFVRIRDELPEYLKGPMTFAYFTGWRARSEVLRMTWESVDLTTGTARLDVGTTKNKKGRLIYLTPDIKNILVPLKRDVGLVFHNNGKPIKNYYKAWRQACVTAKLPDKIPHDFRRTAIRNMVRQGVREHTAMLMSGHKTRAVFDRYDIVNEQDLKDAAETLATFSATFPGVEAQNTAQVLNKPEDATLAQSAEQLIRNQ